VVAVLLLQLAHSLPMKEINGEYFVLTPAGPVSARCVTELPQEGSRIEKLEDGGVKVEIFENADLIETMHLPPCANPFPSSSVSSSSNEKEAFPADYDGWLAYSSFENTGGVSFDSFLGTFSVPPTPQNTPAVLYVFTGLQNVNWIPKITPAPPNFDIIQPVLQYPGDQGNYWSVKSWYVTVDAGVQVTQELKLSVGDSVFGNMTMVGKDSWFIGSTSTQTGKSVSLVATHPRLATQPWAYCTVECYGCKGCETEPTTPIQFTSLAITADQQPVTPQWTAFQSPHPICNTTANIVSPTSVTMTFGS